MNNEIDADHAAALERERIATYLDRTGQRFTDALESGSTPAGETAERFVMLAHHSHETAREIRLGDHWKAHT